RGLPHQTPGLVFAKPATADGPAEELIDTGIQRLLGDLDELPHPVLGYQLLEPPSRRETLAPHALTPRELRRHANIASIVLTVGCKFRCQYCPIPAYNQRQHRTQSGERIADEMGQIVKNYGINFFFGTDDNFFNETKRTLEITETLARKQAERKRPHCKILYGTEATVHDTIRLQEHISLIRRAVLSAVGMAGEDLTGTLVKKGQSEIKTIEAFSLLRGAGIAPIPMMMHSDPQPLFTWKNNYGLLNQMRTLRKAGALYTQILMLTPSAGSKWYEDTYTSGLAFDSVNGQSIEPHIVDGNYVVASKHPRPWLKQLNLLAAYLYFFNPLRLLIALVWSQSHLPLADADTRPAAEIARYSPLQRLTRWLFLQTRAHLLDATHKILGTYGVFQTRHL